MRCGSYGIISMLATLCIVMFQVQAVRFRTQPRAIKCKPDTNGISTMKEEYRRTQGTNDQDCQFDSKPKGLLSKLLDASQPIAVLLLCPSLSNAEPTRRALEAIDMMSGYKEVVPVEVTWAVFTYWVYLMYFRVFKWMASW
jgi:hypothetical protein